MAYIPAVTPASAQSRLQQGWNRNKPPSGSRRDVERMGLLAYWPSVGANREF